MLADRRGLGKSDQRGGCIETPRKAQPGQPHNLEVRVPWQTRRAEARLRALRADGLLLVLDRDLTRRNRGLPKPTGGMWPQLYEWEDDEELLWQQMVKWFDAIAAFQERRWRNG